MILQMRQVLRHPLHREEDERDRQDPDEQAARLLLQENRVEEVDADHAALERRPEPRHRRQPPRHARVRAEPDGETMRRGG